MEWNKFRHLKSFLCVKRIGLNINGKVHEAHVRSCIIYGGEAWATSVEDMRKLERKKRCIPSDCRTDSRLQTCGAHLALSVNWRCCEK